MEEPQESAIASFHEWVVLLFRHSQEKPVELVAGAVKYDSFAEAIPPARLCCLFLCQRSSSWTSWNTIACCPPAAAEAVALCPVVQVHGSTPRAAGAKMLVHANESLRAVSLAES